MVQVKEMRSYEEVVLALQLLEKEREEQIGKTNYPIALSIGAHIQLIKWILCMEEK